MAWAADGTGQLSAILESGSSEEEEEEEDEEAAVVQQHPPHGQEPVEAEQRLAELEQASQALLAELSALETQFEVERMCREQAEAYAVQVKQENKQLKRLSLAPAAPEALLEELSPEEDPDPDPAQCYGQQLEALQKKISWLLEQRKDLSSQVQELQRLNQDLQDQLELGQEEQQRLRAALGTSQRALRSFKRVSHIITQDYCEAMQQLELEQDLRLHAEAFAHEVLVQTQEAKRQSSVLLQGPGPSAPLRAALQDAASPDLQEAGREQSQRVQELEEELGKRPGQEELDEARAALAEAEEEKLQLRMRLQEAEQRLRELQEEVRLLQEKLAQDPLQQSRAPAVPAPPPPPPPPLPPPAPTVPVDPLLAIRQRKGLVKLQRCKPEAEDVKARAVQEMMERIKNGVVLRPAKDRDPLGQGTSVTGSKRRSAALELQSLLGAMRRASRRAGARQSSLKGRDQQLEAILQRRRRALDVAPEEHSDAEAEEWPDPGDQDLGAAPSGGSPPGSRDRARAPFRSRLSSGLPRTRPRSRPGRGSGEPG